MTTARPAQLVFGVFLNSWLACAGELLVGGDRWHTVSFLWVFLTQLSQAAILVGSVITPGAAGKYHLTTLQMKVSSSERLNHWLTCAKTWCPVSWCVRQGAFKGREPTNTLPQLMGSSGQGMFAGHILRPPKPWEISL